MKKSSTRCWLDVTALRMTDRIRKYSPNGRVKLRSGFMPAVEIEFRLLADPESGTCSLAVKVLSLLVGETFTGWFRGGTLESTKCLANGAQNLQSDASSSPP